MDITLLWVYEKSLHKYVLVKGFKLYPDPGSNRDGLLHWCLRPARLPIPPSGLAFAGANIRRVLDSTKGIGDFFLMRPFLFWQSKLRATGGGVIDAALLVENLGVG